jgi:hypothetical protein
MAVTGKGFGAPDETRTFDNGKVDIIVVGGFTFGKFTLEPGWQWSKSVKPLAKTDSCQVHHAGYVVQGTLHVVSTDGGERDLKAGDVYEIEPGHDGWVVGDETYIGIEVMGAEKYAKP